MSKKTVHEILDDEDFKALSGKKNVVSIVLTILELVLYFGFIGLIAFNKQFLSQKMGGEGATTIGIPIAVGTILGSIVLTGIYIFWANSTYDSEVKKVKDNIIGG